MRRDEFLRSQKVLRLATTSGGMPHVVPVWYMYAAKKFYIGTNSRTQKARNIALNGRVSFCIDRGTNAPDIYGVMGQGRAELVRKKGQVERIARRILARYFARMNQSARELLDDTDCIIIITPDRMIRWSY